MTRIEKYKVDIRKIFDDSFYWHGDAEVIFPKHINLKLLETIMPKTYELKITSASKVEGDTTIGSAEAYTKSRFFPRKVGLFKKDILYKDRGEAQFKNSLWPVILDYGDMAGIWDSNDEDLNTTIEILFGKRYHV